MCLTEYSLNRMAGYRHVLLNQNKLKRKPENSKDECLCIRYPISDVPVLRLICFKQKLTQGLRLVPRFF